MRLTEVLREVRLLTESGFLLQVRWPDPDELLVDHEHSKEAILIEAWVDTTLTVLMVQSSETAMDYLESIRDDRLEVLMVSIKNFITKHGLENRDTPWQVEDAYDISPRSEEGQMFTRRNALYRFYFDRKLSRREVADALSTVANQMKGELPGIHVGSPRSGD